MITRHNYEEFFILYMDNELSSEDRRLVETFVAQHPDLKEELELLSHYKLEPDTSVVFAGKDELMKVNGETPVTLTNYEEWLLLYIDKELNAGQRKAVEAFLAANPAIQPELELLTSTKLAAETIVFADKSTLYRKEERSRPVIYRWWRAAAAVLILAIGVASVILSGRESRKNAADIARMPLNQGTREPDKDQVNPVGQEPKETVKEMARVEERVEHNNVNHQPVVPAKPGVDNAMAKTGTKELPKSIVQQDKKDDNSIASNNINGNNLPKPDQNPNFNKFTDAVVDVKPKHDIPKEIMNPKNLNTEVAVTKTTTPPSDIVQASDQELETNGKKNKLRGLFRKVARTFEKRTNIDPTDDDNKLLVAGLSFKLK